MQPPIAEIPPPAPRPPAKSPPLALSVLVGVGVLLGVVDLFFGQTEPLLEIAVWNFALYLGLMVTFHFVPLFFLWRGYNWARWTLIVLGVLGAIFLFWPEVTPSSEWINWLYLPYDVILIVLLWIPAIRRYFEHAPNKKSPTP